MAQVNHGPVYDLARLVLLRGPIALSSLPHLKIGNLLTADRREIESLRTFAQVIRRYEKMDKGKKPLSIGVFGPPGAGKSFAVRELSFALVQNIAWLEFNLSQFSSSGDLNGAFHQIRDQVLQHKIPVAFFDEFDSKKYDWLQYLLAPMQDGKFQDGQLTHTLGKCIFVFAGGTSPTFETFGPPSSWKWQWRPRHIEISGLPKALISRAGSMPSSMSLAPISARFPCNLGKTQMQRRK